MLPELLKSIFGSHNDRVVKKYMRVAEEINSYEKEFSNFSDTQLREMTVKFRRRLEEGETLDDSYSGKIKRLFTEETI